MPPMTAPGGTSACPGAGFRPCTMAQQGLGVTCAVRSTKDWDEACGHRGPILTAQAPQHQGLGTLPLLPALVHSEDTMRTSLWQRSHQVWANQGDFSAKEMFLLPL